MFINERLFTIQVFTITRVHCKYDSRWWILRHLVKLRHIILPFASTNLALVSRERCEIINSFGSIYFMPTLTPEWTNKQTIDCLSAMQLDKVNTPTMRCSLIKVMHPPCTKQSSTQQHSLLAKVGPDYQVVELGMKWNHARNRSERINYLTPFHCSPMLG